MTAIKSVDARGRLTLGREFANLRVIVKELEDGVLQLMPATVVPAREAWLYENPTALAAVKAGLEQARAGQFAEPPDLEGDEDS